MMRIACLWKRNVDRSCESSSCGTRTISACTVPPGDSCVYYYNNHSQLEMRTILVLGYWVLGDIHRFWIVLLLGDIFCCDTKYDTNQPAPSTCLLSIIIVIIIDILHGIMLYIFHFILIHFYATH